MGGGGAGARKMRMKMKKNIYQSCRSCQELLQAKVTAPPYAVLNYTEKKSGAKMAPPWIVWWPDSVGGLDFEYARSPRQLNGNNFFVSWRT